MPDIAIVSLVRKVKQLKMFKYLNVFRPQKNILVKVTVFNQILFAMKKHPVTWFYILAFGISWLGMISAALGSRAIAPFDSPYVQILSIFYAVGPALAAVIVSQVSDGKTGVQALNQGLSQWRVGLVWYVVAVLGPVVLAIAAQVVTKLLSLPATIAVSPADLSF